MTDTKLLLTTLADKFDERRRYCATHRDLETDVAKSTNWQLQVIVWSQAANELREALAAEELQHGDIGKLAADWEANADKYCQPIDHFHDAVPYLMGMSEREFKRHIADDKPAATDGMEPGYVPLVPATSDKLTFSLKTQLPTNNEIVGTGKAWPPKVTNNQIVGIVAANRYRFNIWAIGQAEEHNGVYNINHGTVRLPSGKKYVYMDRIEQLCGIELSSFEELSDANRHPHYSELMSFLPSLVRRQVAK